MKKQPINFTKDLGDATEENSAATEYVAILQDSCPKALMFSYIHSETNNSSF